MRIAVGLLLLASCGDDASTGTGSGGDGGEGVGGAVGGATSSTGAAGGVGGMPNPFVPEPIPVLSEDVTEPCQAAIDNAWPPQFLYDICDAKRFPTDVDRELACPTLDLSATVPLAGGGDAVYAPSSAEIVFDTTTLADVVSPDLFVTVILIRRVNGVPHYRYLSNGKHGVAYQPWSTSKFLAAANAAATLRFESAGEVGLTASVGNTRLGDLVTSLASYDGDPYSSNSLGRYFHNIGGRSKANALIHGAWLDRPSGETFGGNYGEAAPNLGYTFEEENGPTISVDPDGSAGPANHLSSFTTAEALKRIVLHREETTQRLPELQWQDVKVLLYGAEGSSKGEFGGLSRDPAILIQSGHDLDYLERRSHGKWRIFSKLGNGTNGELLDVGYGCFPVLDDADAPVAGWGREFVISAQLATGGATWKARDRLLAEAYRAIVTRIIDGRI